MNLSVRFFQYDICEQFDRKFNKFDALVEFKGFSQNDFQKIN